MRNAYRRGYRDKDKPKIKVTYILMIILLTLIICFALYMISANDKSSGIDVDNSVSLSNITTANIVETTPETTAETTTTEPPVPVMVNPVPESESLDFTYFDNCVFVGDSITEGLSGYQFLQPENVLAGKGMNIDKIETAAVTTTAGEVTILDALKTANFQTVYIMLGSNGIAWLSNEKMIEEYSGFIDQIEAELPDAEIYILSIPPVSVEKETTTEGSIQNSAIDSYNSALLNMANTKEVHFVDINTALKGNDGKLPSDRAGKDGMHFKKDTYQIMLDYILKHTAKD